LFFFHSRMLGVFIFVFVRSNGEDTIIIYKELDFLEAQFLMDKTKRQKKEKVREKEEEKRYKYMRGRICLFFV